MHNKTLLCTVGLPRSGKTTWARAYSKAQGVPIVNPDSVRLAIHGQRFIAEAEPFVWAVVKAMVNALFLAGHDEVIVDATNTTRKRRDDWKSPKWTTRFLVIPTSAEECVRRAGYDAEMAAVIQRMAAAWEPLGDDELRLP
jgi:predicted kinase